MLYFYCEAEFCLKCDCLEFLLYSKMFAWFKPYSHETWVRTYWFLRALASVFFAEFLYLLTTESFWLPLKLPWLCPDHSDSPLLLCRPWMPWITLMGVTYFEEVSYRIYVFFWEEGSSLTAVLSTSDILIMRNSLSFISCGFPVGFSISSWGMKIVLA